MKLLAILLLTSQLSHVDAAKVQQKDIMSTMMSISNLGLMAFNKKDEAEGNDEASDLQLVQLDKLEQDELSDLMKETFTQPQEQEPSVSEILDKEDKEHDGKGDDNTAVSTDQENMSHMTLSEQMALAKRQAADIEKKAQQQEAEKKRKAAAEAKRKQQQKEREEKERIANEPLRQKQAEEKEMDDFVNSQLEQQRKHTEEYYKELNQDVPDKEPKAVTQVKNTDEKVDAEVAKADAEKHTSFANADEALDTMGSSLAQHQLEVSMKRSGMNELIKAKNEQLSQQELAAKAAEEQQRKQEEAIQAEERAKLDAVAQRENRLRSKLESLEQFATAEKPAQKKASEEESAAEPLPAAPVALPETREERLKQKLSSLSLVEGPAADQAMSTGQDDVNLNNQILNQISKPQPVAPVAPVSIPKPGKVNVQDLIAKAVAHQKDSQAAPSAPAPQPVAIIPTAPVAPIEVEKPNEEAPSKKPQPPRALRPGEKSTTERVEETLQHELIQNGVQAPSDITRALVDSSAGGEPLGHGFFGKYLKKHIDMKKAAEAKVVEEQKAEKERIAEMKRQLSEKIKADPEPVPDPTTGAAPPKKHHKKTLSERAEARLVEEQEKKANEAADRVEEAMKTDKLVQAQYLGLDEFVEE